MKFRAILDDEYDIEERKPFILKPWMKTALFFAAWIFILNLFTVLFMTHEKIIYFWDSATYWSISRNIAKGSLSEGSFLYNVCRSICYDDYNCLAALIPAAVERIFGGSRFIYVMTLANFYLIPYMIVLYHLCTKLGKAPKVTMSIIMLLLPIIPSLLVIGFADVGGLTICLLCIDLYYTKKGEKPAPWKYAVIGVLLVAAMLWRRWYAFFSVSFITAMVADTLMFGKERKWYNTAITIAVAGGILVVFLNLFLKNILLADYGTMYADYKFTVDLDFKLLTRHFGVILLLMILVCTVLAAVYKKEKRTIFLWIQLVVCFLMFVSVQTHGQQHLLLYVPAVATLLILIMRYISKEWMLVAICALAVLQTGNTFIPREQPGNLQSIKHYALIPDISLLPAVDGGAPAKLEIKHMLDSVVGEGETLGVLASSFTLNDDVLRNVEASLGLFVNEEREDYLVSVPVVDSRDRDLTSLYTCGYMLVAIPAQTHLAPGSQTVVEEGVASFVNWSDFAQAYQEMYDYETTLNGNITLKLFRRVRDVTPEEKAAFESRLYQK